MRQPLSLSLIFLATFRLSTCPSPPPMVKHFNYNVSQIEALSNCQSALVKLGYEIALFEPLDRHLVTKMRTIRVGLRKAKYRLFVKIEDRVRVYIYAETRIFTRFSERGLGVGDLTEYKSRDNLPLSFQKVIFDPIIKSFVSIGMVYWNEYEGNKADDLEIREAVKNIKGKKMVHRKKTLENEKTKKIILSELYLAEKDYERLDAMEEAEHYVDILYSKNLSNVDSFQWSLISISQIISSHDEALKEIIRSVVTEQPNYSGKCEISWIITPLGTVREVSVEAETTPYTQEKELVYKITNEVKKWYFRPSESETHFIRLNRLIEYSGNYHNIKFRLFRPKIVDVIEKFPPDTLELIKGTLFDN